MAKLTDKERKMILAELTMGSSIRACASKYHTSVGTVQRIKHESSDEIRQQIEEKNAENTKDVLAFMEMQKGSACNLIAMLLDALNDPEKIADTPLVKIATTLGIVIDKFTANESPKTESTAENNLFEAIEACCSVEDFSSIPELAEQRPDDSEVSQDDL